MHLSKQPKLFCCFFIAFLESTLNFEHFEKKFELHSLSISEIIDSERRGYLNAEKVLFLKILPEWTREWYFNINAGSKRLLIKFNATGIWMIEWKYFLRESNKFGMTYA